MRVRGRGCNDLTLEVKAQIPWKAEEGCRYVIENKTKMIGIGIQWGSVGGDCAEGTCFLLLVFLRSEFSCLRFPCLA